MGYRHAQQGQVVTAIEIGRMNRLRVERAVDIGFYLAPEDESVESILLPGRYAPEGLCVGDDLDVFLYADSEDRLVATTETPLAMANEVANLQVVATNQVGAFLDWGLPKDLLLPFGEQKGRPREGQYCLVYIYKDKYADRLVATMRLNRHIGKTPGEYTVGQRVEIVIAARTDLGYKAIIHNAHWGLLYENEVFKHLRPGQRLYAWVKKVLGEGKIDLSLTEPGTARFATAADEILAALEDAGGFLPLHDKSSPEAIRRRFGMSKKNFKAALGKLYRERQITMSPEGIQLTAAGDAG